MCVEDHWVELQPTPIQRWADLHDSWADICGTAAEPTADSATGFISDTAAVSAAGSAATGSAAGSSHKRPGEGL